MSGPVQILSRSEAAYRLRIRPEVLDALVKRGLVRRRSDGKTYLATTINVIYRRLDRGLTAADLELRRVRNQLAIKFPVPRDPE